MTMDELTKFRRQIDRIDLVLITALSERMALMEPIGRYKKEHNISAFQEKRDQQIMKRVKAFAKDYGLEPGFAEEIFESIFNEAKRLQQKTINGIKGY